MITNRRMIFHLALVALLTAFALPLVTNHAQASEPTSIIDAAFADISKQVGKPVTRGGDSTFTWEQDTFGDASLGCPKPGQMYAQVVTKGYKIIINYAGTSYDYRASLDGSNLFLCSTTGGAPTFVATAPAPSSSSATFINPFAFISTSGNVLLAHIGDSTTAALTNSVATPIPPLGLPPQQFGRLQWSPDGSKLVFFEFKTGNLYLARSGQPLITVATGLQTYFPAVWSADGTKIAFAVPTKEQKDTGEVQQVQAVSVTSNGVSAPQFAGTFTHQTGCGGGNPDPAAQLYDAEAGFGGNKLVLAWTDKGFVASPNCSGVGLVLTDSTGKVVWQVPDAARAVISPDHTRAVAIRHPQNSGNQPAGANALMLVDLSSGAITQLQSEAGADQVAWSADGSTVLYSTLSNPRQTKGSGGNNALGTQLFGSWPIDTVTYAVTLWRISASGGQATRLFQRDGRGIGIIATAPDNSGVLSSFVTSSADMLNIVNNNGTLDKAVAAAPTVQLLYVPWAGGAPPTAIAPGGQPAFGKGPFSATISAAQAPSLASASSSAIAPPNLVVGGGAIVTTTKGDTLNVRQSPSTSAAVLAVLKPGAILKVMGGPQSADGLRWWQVRTTEGVIGWVADQVTDASGTVNTLTPAS